MEVEGKVALVTGAAIGIGFEISKELLRNGAQGVLLADMNETAGQEALEKLRNEFGNNRANFIKTDVTSDTEFENAFNKVVGLFGKLDIVVNNAGIVNDQNYKLEIDVNFLGVIRGIMLGLKYMGKDQLGKGGVILNISSTAAVELQQCFPMYSSTKAAVLNLSKGFGHPFHSERTGVTVIALCPGKTETALLANDNMLDGCLVEVRKIVAEQDLQQPDAVGRAAIHAIKAGKSASVYLVDQNKLFKLNIPEWPKMVETVLQKI